MLEKNAWQYFKKIPCQYSQKHSTVLFVKTMQKLKEVNEIISKIYIFNSFKNKNKICQPIKCWTGAKKIFNFKKDP